MVGAGQSIHLPIDHELRFEVRALLEEETFDLQLVAPLERRRILDGGIRFGKEPDLRRTASKSLRQVAVEGNAVSLWARTLRSPTGMRCPSGVNQKNET
jgi:hypothetical protein